MLRNKSLQVLIIIIGLVFIVNLSRNIFRLLQTTNQLKEAEQKVSQLEKETEALAKKKELYQSSSFIEEEARNKLNMVKEGETVVILPPNFGQVIEGKGNQAQKPLPNWRQWLNLFL
ncbi:MAG: septum formation initiator family protein [Candidatus Shapirobacteria bacterium]|nr:septum formation initiator family protein [Candidatus Shapirobacteria bacterium]